MKKIQYVKQVVFNDEIINITVDKGRRKNMYILIQNAEVMVRVPFKISDYEIDDFIKNKLEWIYKKLTKQSSKENGLKDFVDGEKVKILGNDYSLKILSYEKKRAVAIQDLINKKVIVKLPYKYFDENLQKQINEKCENKISEIEKKEEIKKQIEKLYFSICLEEVKAAMGAVTSYVGIAPKEYRVRRLKRAWGNCSSTKNITINVKLAMHSRQAIEYVVLHEVCHLKYLNHSKNFWNMVESYMPNYKEAEKELNG